MTVSCEKEKVLVTQYVMNMLISDDHKLMIDKDNLCEGASHYTNL